MSTLTIGESFNRFQRKEVLSGIELALKAKVPGLNAPHDPGQVVDQRAVVVAAVYRWLGELKPHVMIQ